MSVLAKRVDDLPQLGPASNVINANAAAMIEVISRAAKDPSISVEKLSGLMDLYERITDKQAQQAYDQAMSEAQAEMRQVATDANNPQTKSRYASYAALDRALRPIYTSHGFGLSFDTEDGAPADHIRLACIISHRQGERRRHHIDMPADGKGAKGGDVMTKTHATGAAVTYGRRYLLGMVFNIAVGDDTDGNPPGRGSKREQSAAVSAAIAGVNLCNSLADLKTWKVKNADGLSGMTSAEQDEVIRLFNSRVAALKESAKA